VLSTDGGSRGRHPSRVPVARILARADRPTLWFNYRMLVMPRFGRRTDRLAWDMEAEYPPACRERDYHAGGGGAGGASLAETLSSAPGADCVHSLGSYPGGAAIA
jgi:hypothetical protein